MKKFQARQGDVMIVEVDEIPASSRPKERIGGDVILAYGEFTGHAHRIKDQKVRWFDSDAEGVSYLDTTGNDSVATLTHEEHSTVAIPPGKKYIARRQREWDEFAERLVAD